MSNQTFESKVCQTLSCFIADYSFSLRCKKCSIKDSYQMFCIVSRCQQSLIFSELCNFSPDAILSNLMAKIEVWLISQSQHFELDIINSFDIVYTPGLPAEPVIPEFTEEVNNKTVVAGREAVLTCHVTHIGSYKVENCLSQSW